MSQKSHYTFGDQGPAAERLRRLAELYRPLSASALEQASAMLNGAPELAIDLGAGPGHTTELLAEVTRARAVIGYERSPDFCAQARARCEASVDFVEFDVGAKDLPIQKVDLGFCRFLLTHLPNPLETMRRWKKAFRLDGLMVFIEVERLSSSDPVLARYYQIIEGVQTEHGQAMSIGQSLESLTRKAGWIVVDSKTVDPGLPASAMATLHRPNLESVRKDPWVQSHFRPEELNEIAVGLERIGAETGDDTPIENFLRVVIARA